MSPQKNSLDRSGFRVWSYEGTGFKESLGTEEKMM